MKNILIPVDFSGFSSSAAKTGIYIAKKTGATIHFLNIANAPDDWEGMTAQEQQKFPEIEANLVEAEIKLQKYSTQPGFSSAKVVTRVMGGAPYKQIVRYAEDHKIDLIIIGAHGISDLDGLFIGSTAQKVMRIAHCLVLSVKKNFNPNTLKRMLFASDFEETGAGQSFKLIKNFALDMGAKIDFAFVNTPNKFVDSDTIEKRIKNFSATQREIKPHIFIHNDHTKEEGIINLTKKLKSNVIALVTHNRKGKKNYAFGITETILFHSDIPVLSQVI
jgi:nucleotide-binding universal stress UspA family protein